MIKQCENMDIPIVRDVDEFKKVYGESDVVMDTIFG